MTELDISGSREAAGELLLYMGEDVREQLQLWAIAGSARLPQRGIAKLNGGK